MSKVSIPTTTQDQREYLEGLTGKSIDPATIIECPKPEELSRLRADLAEAERLLVLVKERRCADFTLDEWHRIDAFLSRKDSLHAK